MLIDLECWIAETPDGMVVGLLVLEKDWIDQLYVLPEWQAQGVGSKLLGHAKRLRPDGLQLWTFASNAPARRFYEDRGFVSGEETDGADNEEHAPDVRYAWKPDEQRRC